MNEIHRDRGVAVGFTQQVESKDLACFVTLRNICPPGKGLTTLHPFGLFEFEVIIGTLIRIQILFTL